MPQMVFAPVAFLEFLEVHESVVPGVEEEVLPTALPVIRPVLRSPARQHFRDRFQELEGNQVEARLAIRPPGATAETPDVAPFPMLNLAHSQMLPQRWQPFQAGDSSGLETRGAFG